MNEIKFSCELLSVHENVQNNENTRGPRGPWVAHLRKRSKVTVEPFTDVVVSDKIIQQIRTFLTILVGDHSC